MGYVAAVAAVTWQPGTILCESFTHQSIYCKYFILNISPYCSVISCLLLVAMDDVNDVIFFFFFLG